ncbi:E3 ubiquitin-protein ligase SINA-like 10 [Tripterygium wilfordii]|uniref:E3 ubiquitin-protein ligase SINA-like 10 n=1 Tax=Tripterygium wilfordii TaxID=458696 RepID=UPI0018F830B5|nr:E3 ubiquitin-protein ligase SINA-like 10 [Tripterygium wilfordii]XP_038710216.1 E3 ubiquitin-protein ligase SINA-like 10 [Tripterygium wilfordii]XP_038710218.1 E3 ubiquitin-protein ligase SINA-like 10 [Tripterygium wilfordii]XP_038710219.1 E3 ubiquitin-protein ligase SINA-like 10 [Tripterygium wilfordii]XP_038710220.1 E3 ubiquitin-protein ligase SINA-like 10 [Tripterygium wilfordii]XP_038710221.1 E3 ubiquitin-protein ligase SINA-like 10 [Tripterygium wilfordii]
MGRAKYWSKSAPSSCQNRKRARIFENQREDQEQEQESCFYEEEDDEEEEEEESSESERECEDGEEPESSKGSMIVFITEPNVLDCDIYYEPLTTPVFQEWHIACSKCCQRLKNKCPSCRLRISSIRCRAIEKILESIRVSCQNTAYGCNETSMLYKLKHHHEKTCVYAPCSCPFANCDYQSSLKQLPLHFDERHPNDLSYSFKYDSPFSINLDENVQCIVLEEDKEGDLFAITKDTSQFFGNAVVISHIIGTAVQRRHPYELDASINEPEGTSTLKIQSFTRNYVPCKSSKGKTPPSAGTSVVIPKDSLYGGCSYLRQVRLSVCIHPSI